MTKRFVRQEGRRQKTGVSGLNPGKRNECSDVCDPHGGSDTAVIQALVPMLLELNVTVEEFGTKRCGLSILTPDCVCV